MHFYSARGSLVAEIVYALCTATSFTCAVLLFAAYRASKAPLLFWTSLGFIGLTLNNLFLFVDLIMLPANDLFFWRTSAALVGMLLLLYGLLNEIK
jgi:hypothetical protein